MPELIDLGTFAQVSIALIGFAAVVSVLSRSRLPPIARLFRIRALLFAGMTALVGSLVPLVLHKFGLVASSLWLSSTALLFCLILTTNFHVWHHIRALHRSGEPTPPTTYFLQPISVGVLILLAYGIAFGQSQLPGIYFVGIFWPLLAGLINFVLLIISIELSGSDRDATLF
jgi:hypothetical protein